MYLCSQSSNVHFTVVVAIFFAIFRVRPHFANINKHNETVIVVLLLILMMMLLLLAASACDVQCALTRFSTIQKLLAEQLHTDLCNYFVYQTIWMEFYLTFSLSLSCVYHTNAFSHIGFFSVLDRMVYVQGISNKNLFFQLFLRNMCTIAQ